MLAYGSKVMLPVEVAFHTHRLTTFQEDLDHKALQEALDLLLSVWGDAFLIETLYKLCVPWLQDSTIRFHSISVRGLVLHRTGVIVYAGEHGKLTAN